MLPIYKYQGERDLNTKKRNGKGSCEHSNTFFKYEGEYVMGVKHGKGKLIYGDGRVYEGDFNQGEITGKGKMTWANGTVYTGEFVDGEKNGYGILESSNLIYDGMWRDNKFEGKGILKNLDEKVIIDGNFSQHKPHGKCKFTDFEGNELYCGEMLNGERNGMGVAQEGELHYSGEWKNNLKNGDGVLTDRKTGIEYNGGFEADKPIIWANEYRVKVIREDKIKPEDQVPAQNSHKKILNPKEQIPEGVIVYEFGSGCTLRIEAEIVYQPPDYQDPTQPTEEQWKQQQAALPKGKKKEEAYVPIMITPPPILLKEESGRTVKVELYQKVEEDKEIAIKINWNNDLAESKHKYEEEKKQRELDLLKEEQVQVETKGAKSKKPEPMKNAKKEVVQEVNPLNIYNNTVTPDNLKVNIENGKQTTHKLEFPENFPKCKMIVKVSDESDQKYFKKLKPASFDVYFDLTSLTEEKKKNPKKKQI